MSPVHEQDVYTDATPLVGTDARLCDIKSVVAVFLQLTGAWGPIESIAWCEYLVPGPVVVVQRAVIAVVRDRICQLMAPVPVLVCIDGHTQFIEPNCMHTVQLLGSRARVKFTFPGVRCHAPVWPTRLLATLVCDTPATNVHYRKCEPDGWCEVAASYYDLWLCLGCGAKFMEFNELRAHQNCTHAPQGPWAQLLQTVCCRTEASFPRHNHGTVASNGELNDYLHCSLRGVHNAIQLASLSQKNHPARDDISH